MKLTLNELEAIVKGAEVEKRKLEDGKSYYTVQTAEKLGVNYGNESTSEAAIRKEAMAFFQSDHAAEAYEIEIITSKGNK